MASNVRPALPLLVVVVVLFAGATSSEARHHHHRATSDWSSGVYGYTGRSGLAPEFGHRVPDASAAPSVAPRGFIRGETAFPYGYYRNSAWPPHQLAVDGFFPFSGTLNPASPYSGFQPSAP